jgi:NAD(P)H-hydrate epimerase
MRSDFNGRIMSRSQSHLFTAAESRAIDARAVAQLGISSFELMRRAGRFAFDTLLARFPEVRRIRVWCGKGNNGGDAYLVAALAHAHGLKVHVVSLHEPASLTGDARNAHATAADSGVPIEVATDGQPKTGFDADVIVDGLLGTGFHGALREAYAVAVRGINAARLPVLSIDIPSGLYADTGAIADVAVDAHVNVAFITRKVGLYTGEGAAQVTVREFSDLGVPSACYREAGVERLYWQAEKLPRLNPSTYKHRQGRVLIAGGDLGMPGAVAMAGEAALRVGAGLVSVATRRENTTLIVARRPELMVVDADDCDARLEAAHVVVLGPGLGREAWGQRLYEQVESSGKPVLLDADGLFWLAARKHWRGGPLFVTPHSAEAARLLEIEVAGVHADRLTAVAQLAERFGCTALLKGPGSVVCQGDRLLICAHGNPGMATAGMGDVLSGIAGGLLAPVFATDGADADTAFAAAVALHSKAADVAAARLGPRSLLATDVIDVLPEMFAA